MDGCTVPIFGVAGTAAAAAGVGISTYLPSLLVPTICTIRILPTVLGTCDLLDSSSSAPIKVLCR